MERGPSRDRISDLYHRALACTPEDRGAFLEEACDGDTRLREEVESLLRFEADSARFLETPAAVVAGDLGRTPDGNQMLNRQLGPYTIVAPLGAGGMGEVYRARDSKLGRDVAIKILPAHFTAEPERRARFAREARLLATLNHPHIGAIYGLEETDGLTALVLELVEGPTLADRLTRGPLPIHEALAIAHQIAEALDAAHEKGIVHRDLKPANIVLQSGVNAAGVPSGEARAKVLDFGLAKTMALGLDGDLTQRPSGSLDGTAEGRILGTPAYMSPEQARGQAVDKRTDIWAFGCVLFEMLAGRRAFDGDTISDTFVSILEREPDWAVLPAHASTSIHTLLDRCLRKDPRKRLHDIADALIGIDDGALSTTPSPKAGNQGSSVTPTRRRERLTWTIPAFLIGAAVAGGSLAVWQPRTAVTTGNSLAFVIGPPPPSTFPLQNFGFAIAPDGSHLTMVAFAENYLALWVQPLGSAEPRRLPGTEGASNPFWSPDARQIGFFAKGKLKTVGLSGEAPRELCDFATGAGGTWNRDGVIISGSRVGPLLRVSSTGGTQTPVTALKEPEKSHQWPWFLPDGEHFLFVAMGDGPSQLRVGSLMSTESTALGTIRSNAAYAAGYLLFVQGGLMAQPFDLSSRQLKDTPHPLNEHMEFWSGRAAFSVAETGLLGYSAGPARPDVQLTWMDRAGKRVGVAGEPGHYRNLSLSPDDRRVAVAAWSAGSNFDIWVIDLDREGDKSRVTSDDGWELDPVWSPDGKNIAFTSDRSGLNSLFKRPSDGSARDELLAGTEIAAMVAPDWSSDDRFMVFVSGADLWIRSLKDGQSTVFLQTPFAEIYPSFSPDGRWIVYSADNTGRPEIHVKAFPSTDPKQTGIKVSLDGGRTPRWRSGHEIFFLAPDGMLMSAHFTATASPTATIPRPLFQTGLALAAGNHPYDVAKDRRRFLIPVTGDTPGERRITMVTNWTARLAR